MKVRVISEHSTNYPYPVEFDQGDRVKLGRRDTEYEGWIRVTTHDGKEGWAPEQFLDAVSETDAIANRKYCARELTTKVGEHLIVRSETNGWLWVETEAGDEGWVPKETVA
jgi:SH3-like domain-containing protein